MTRGSQRKWLARYPHWRSKRSGSRRSLRKRPCFTDGRIGSSRSSSTSTRRTKLPRIMKTGTYQLKVMLGNMIKKQQNSIRKVFDRAISLRTRFDHVFKPRRRLCEHFPPGAGLKYVANTFRLLFTTSLKPTFSWYPLLYAKEARLSIAVCHCLKVIYVKGPRTEKAARPALIKAARIVMAGLSTGGQFRNNFRRRQSAAGVLPGLLRRVAEKCHPGVCVAHLGSAKSWISRLPRPHHFFTGF